MSTKQLDVSQKLHMRYFFHINVYKEFLLAFQSPELLVDKFRGFASSPEIRDFFAHSVQSKDEILQDLHDTIQDYLSIQNEVDRLQFLVQLYSEYIRAVDEEHWLTFSEAAYAWGLKDTSTLRKAVASKRFASTELKKEGNTWYVTRTAMEQLYGPQLL